MTKTPLISIGIPAYNSAENIGFTIEGLLAQSYGDFELIISDNASTDATRDVVESYMKIDPRIRYERQPINIGANPNWSSVARRARGDLFKWSSSSDWCAPTFLERCKNELLAHDDTVLVVPRTRLFHGNVNVAEDYESDLEVTDESPSARLEHLMTKLCLNNLMNGLIRMSALKRTRLMERYHGGDVVLMGHLVLQGKFRLLDDRLFYRRMEPATATALQDRTAVRRFHYPQLGARSLFQYTKCQVGWVRAVLAPPMSPRERRRALLFVAKRCYWERIGFLEDARGVWRYLTRRDMSG
jgi:glycosyltransferase involved in cell wall biosynthesis